MVENHALIEWSPEVGLALSSRFSSWVVQEDEAENLIEETEDGRSVLRGRSSFNSMQLMQDDRSVSNGSTNLYNTKRNSGLIKMQEELSSPSNMQDARAFSQPSKFSSSGEEI